MELFEEDFEAMLASATTPSDISKHFVRDCDWVFDTRDDEEAAIVRAAEQAIELVSTVAQGLELSSAFGPFDGVITREHDTRLFNKLILLASNEDELASIFEDYVDGSMSVTDQMYIRQHIRKIFDKADELGVQARINIYS